MKEDKFAPKIDDNVDVVHKLHQDLIKTQQEENKKARDNFNKHVEPAKPNSPLNTPQNPEAPQNQPVEENSTE